MVLWIQRRTTLRQGEQARTLFVLHEVAGALHQEDKAEDYLRDAAKMRNELIGKDNRRMDILTRRDFDELSDPLG